MFEHVIGAIFPTCIGRVGKIIGNKKYLFHPISFLVLLRPKVEAGLDQILRNRELFQLF